MAKRRSAGEGSIFFRETKGLRVAKLTLPEGWSKSKYSKKQSVVREWLVTQQNQLRHGMMARDDTITVAGFVGRYMEDVAKHTLRPKTIEVNTALIRLHIIPTIGKIKLSQLRPDHLQSLYAQKLDSGLSKRTVQFIHSIIHKVLQQAMIWGLVPRNVASLVKAPKPSKRPPTIFSIAESITFLNAVKDHRFFPMYIIALYLGLREGEVLGIHREDVDLAHGVINVRHSIVCLKGIGLVVSEPKNESSKRSVTIPDTALQVLKTYLEGLSISKGLIFTTSTGRPYSPRNLVRHFKSVLEENNLPDIRFYDLRHTSASLLLAAGVHPKIVQERFGHSSIVLTLDTYSHLIPGIQNIASNKMDDILKVPPGTP